MADECKDKNDACIGNNYELHPNLLSRLFTYFTVNGFRQAGSRKINFVKLRNEEIRRLVQQDRTVAKDIPRKHVYGISVNRMEEGRLPKTVMQWTPPGKRRRGGHETLGERAWSKPCHKKRFTRVLLAGERSVVIKNR